MRVSNEEKKKSHGRILEGSARLLRKKGLENTSVQDVMGEAGMKVGGFYRHFDNKNALVDAALQSAFEEVVSFVEGRMETHEPEKVLAGYRAHYLSERHVSEPETGCPVAALAGDVGRAAGPLKASFGVGVQHMIATMSKGMRGSAAERRNRAVREFAMLVGAVTIARACDQKTRRAVLAACRTAPREA